MPKHTRNFILSMGAYILLTLLAVWFVRSASPIGLLQGIVTLLPVIPGIFVVLAVVGAIRTQDEMQQRISLEAVSLAFGLVFLLTLTESFLQMLGYTPVDPGVRLLAMGMLWALGVLIARRRFA